MNQRLISPRNIMIPEEEIMEVMKNAGLKTVDQFAQLRCDDCKSLIFLSLTDFRNQLADNSVNNWTCPTCKGSHCAINVQYSFRMLAH